MATATSDTRKERAAARALARSALYRLLSQALAWPGEREVAALRESDLPRAREAALLLDGRSAALVAALAAEIEGAAPTALQAEHRRVLSHTIAPDCPPCEALYTARHVFQETHDLSDIGGFLRAFGLDLAERERPDHITVELEFMHFLAYKEAYALANHGPARARLCREVQRKFMTDHLGRWGPEFARLLERKAAGGYLGGAASLLGAFLQGEIAFLRARPEIALISQHWRQAAPEESACPLEGCP